MTRLFVISDKDGNRTGGQFDSVQDAKDWLPDVAEWRPDESRPMGWNGWLPDPATGKPVTGSKPDY